MTTTITAVPYRPGTTLDTELAALAYAAVRGWPDQRPITPDLVASRLTASAGHLDTQLVLAHYEHTLVGWAALRPPPDGGTGRLWGPIVHPDHHGLGYGRQLLANVEDTALYRACRDRVTTAEIPSTRVAARALFTSHSWTRCGGATLLHAHPAPPPPPLLSHAELHVEPLRDYGHGATQLGQLYHATYPDHGIPTALSTLTRWAADHRFRGDHVLFAHDRTGSALGAVLLYPLAHTEPSEPAEVLIADLLVDAGIERNDAVVDALLAAALRTIGSGSAVRAVTPDPRLAKRMAEFGLSVRGGLDYFRPATLPVVSEPPTVDDGDPDPAGAR